MTGFWATLPPPVVLMPSEPVREGDEQAQVVARQVGEDLLLTAYSSVAALVRCCGEDQSWVALASDDVEALKISLGARAVVLDLPLTEARPA